MADAVFLLGAYLGGGEPALLRQDEQGVVAEAVFPFFLKADSAVHVALGLIYAALGPHQGYGAGVVGAPVLHALQLFQQQAVVGRVVPMSAAEAGGVDAGGPAQGVHAYAAVVGDGPAAGYLRYLPGLLHGILHKGLAVLHGLMVNARLLQGDYLVEHPAQDVLYLNELVGVVGCDNKFHFSVFPFRIVR